MADLTATVLDFRDDTDRAAACLAAIQEVLRRHRFKAEVSEWLTFTSTPKPEGSPDLFDRRSVDWLGWEQGKLSFLDSETVNQLARERKAPC